MKTMRSLFLMIILALGLNSIAFSQLDGTTDFLKGGVNDAKVLFQEYLKPYANILGTNLNAGWYNTAKPHKLGGFDITFTMNAAMAPSADQIFDVSKLTLSSEATVTGGTTSPTIAGKNTDNRPTIAYSKTAPAPLTGKIQYASYKLPDGTGLNLLPTPMAQLGIGLPFGTDVTIRYLPSIDLGDVGNIGLWGVGIKHSIKQWIPVISKIPVLDITAQGGYTKLSTSAKLNYTPADIVVGSVAAVDYVNDPNKWLGQKLELGVSAWTVNLVISETIPILCFYQAIGYSSSDVNLGLKGNFPFTSIETNVTNPNFGKPVVTAVQGQGIVKDPISLDMKSSKNLRLNAGVRIKLGIITLHADYTKANYSVYTAGLGISFR
jgi:hypothetical protein